MGSIAVDEDSPLIHTIRISDAEYEAHQLKPETIGEGVYALHRVGMLVLENVVDLKHIDTLNEMLCKEVIELESRSTTHFNGESAAIQNIAQSPPRTANMMYEDIWANDFALTFISAILGPVPHVNYVLGNTALPGGTARQGVHADLTFNYPDFPFSYVVNYYLCDSDASNGATEVWPGSHKLSRWSKHKPSSSRIQEPYVEERRKTHPPVQAAVKKGGVVIRDLRVWHAGIPNEDPANAPRIMLAFAHFPAWWNNPMTVTLPASAKSLIKSWGA